MRQSEDLCLLCGLNQASKRNSHILPKFLSTQFLITPDNKKIGYSISSETAMNGKEFKIQDSPKEDYILCPDCESYFGIIERISSHILNNWEAKVQDGTYKINTIKEDFQILEYSSQISKVIFLLAYSIFWRASISNHDLFANFKLKEKLQNSLKSILLIYRSTHQNNFLVLLKDNPNIEIFPLGIITSRNFDENSANILIAPPTIDPYCLVSDQFAFMLFEKNGRINSFLVEDFCNKNVNDSKIMIFPYKLWQDTIVKGAFKFLIKQYNGK